MVKFNSKRLFAAIMATTMVFGSSLTAFAADAPGTVNSDGTGTYEGNLPEYPAPSITMPTITAGTYTYIGDPNGLIQRTNSAHYEDATWSGNGIYFQTEENKYTDTSAPIEITNNSAYAVDVTVTMAQKTAGKNVEYTDDNTFANSTSEQIYLALTDGTNTSAMTQKTADGSTTYTPATLNIALAGKPSNYEFKFANGAYSIAAKTGDLTWNKSSVVAKGAANLNANWAGGTGDAAIAFPAVTVTYKIGIGAKPIFIKDGVAKDVTLATKGADLTIKDIKFGATEVPKTMYEATAIAADKAATLTLKEAFTSFAYGKVPADGLVFTVTYSNDSVESFTLVK